MLENDKKNLEDDMVPLGDGEFPFECHAGVSCFTFCCRNVNLTLYPYDIIRLKKSLNIDSEEFMRTHTFLQKEHNPCFPSVKLKLLTDDKKSCPFLKEDGCSVYNDRPSACRTYPLEVAVGKENNESATEEYFFLTNHSYCLGHGEAKRQTVKQWSRSQKLHAFNLMNSLWAEVDALFASNPWKGEGAGGEKQQIAFMVCYNIDSFREFVRMHKLIQQFRVDKPTKKMILSEDSELLKFGFEWLKLILTGKSSLVMR
jgi:Fe-S-cluster containining protein